MRKVEGFRIFHDLADEVCRLLYGFFEALTADNGRRDDGRKDVSRAAAVAADFFRLDPRRPAVIVNEVSDARITVDPGQDDA